PDRASAVPYGQAGENAMRFPRLAHRSAAVHKLHSTPQQHRMNLISGSGETSSRLPIFRRFGAKPDKKIVDGQAASPSSWKTPFIATRMVWWWARSVLGCAPRVLGGELERRP